MAPRRILPFVALVLLVVAAFAGVRRNGFVPYDDDVYITENPAVRAGLTTQGVRWAFASVGYGSNWHPLTWLSHMADVQLFGLDPASHHVVGLALYAAACTLLLHVLHRCAGRLWCAFIAAGLFAIHPLRVESVAWAAERKDVLGLLFGMLTLAAWLSWVRRPGSRRRYVAVLGVYCAGLLSKPTLVVLPPLLLLLAWWPLGAWGAPRREEAASRVPPVIAGTVLLLVPAVCAGIMTLLAQRAGGGLLDVAAPPVGMRLENAIVSIPAYIGMVLLPRDLAVFYPLPPDIATGAVVAAALFVALFSAGVWRLRRSAPFLLAGWLWYLAALLPVLGLVPVGAQSMADRYTLFPSIGLAVGGVWSAAALARSHAIARRATAVGAAAVVLVLIPLTRRQVEFWRDGDALFSRALGATRGNWQIEHEYGVALLNAKRNAEAERHLREAVRLRPDHLLAHYNLAGALFWQGRAAEAVGEYGAAVRLRPDFAEGHYRLARALAYLGRKPEALAEYDAALRLEPGHVAAAQGRQRILEEAGRER